MQWQMHRGLVAKDESEMKKNIESEGKRSLKRDISSWEKWFDSKFSARHFCEAFEDRRMMDIYDCAVLKQDEKQGLESEWFLVHAWLADEKEVSDGEAEEIGEVMSGIEIRIKFCPICGEELK